MEHYLQGSVYLHAKAVFSVTHSVLLLVLMTVLCPGCRQSNKRCLTRACGTCEASNSSRGWRFAYGPLHVSPRNALSEKMLSGRGLCLLSHSCFQSCHIQLLCFANNAFDWLTMGEFYNHTVLA